MTEIKTKITIDNVGPLMFNPNTKHTSALVTAHGFTDWFAVEGEVKDEKLFRAMIFPRIQKIVNLATPPPGKQVHRWAGA